MPSLTREFYLTLVRHGQTVANELKIIQGQSDTPLTRLGETQATALGAYLSQKINRFQRIYSSDLGRAYSTSKIIASFYDHCQITKDELLRERRYGLYEGKLVEDLKSEAFRLGYTDKNFTKYAPEGAETMEEVQNRVAKFLYDSLLLQDDTHQDCCPTEEILVVTHWATIRELLKIFQPFVAKGSIGEEHLLESPNVAINRFKVRYHRLIGSSNSMSTGANGAEMLADRFKLDIDVICIHQTSHLRVDQVSFNSLNKSRI